MEIAVGVDNTLDPAAADPAGSAVVDFSCGAVAMWVEYSHRPYSMTCSTNKKKCEQTSRIINHETNLVIREILKQ